jgi:hypothetical protein
MKLPPRHVPRDRSSRPKIRLPLSPPLDPAQDKIGSLAVDLAREWGEDSRTPLLFSSTP